MENNYIANDEAVTIVRLLAKGKGGYNYLAEYKNGLVVLKQIHYEPCEYYTFEENKLAAEVRDYNTLRSVGILMPKLLFYDMERQYLLKEYIPGETLAQLAAKDMVTEAHIAQISAMCDILYPNKLNIDYYPTNFIEYCDRLYYVDYECSQYSDKWNFMNWGITFLRTGGMDNGQDKGDIL